MKKWTSSNVFAAIITTIVMISVGIGIYYLASFTWHEFFKMVLH